MSYNIKTAVHVTDEFTRQNLIEFFEAIKSDCNLVKNFEKDEIEVGEIWGIFNGMLEYLGNSYNDVKNLSNYTILNGVPQGWREEMGNKTEIELQSKINQLEDENKELELTEGMKEIISEINYIKGLVDNKRYTNAELSYTKLTEQIKDYIGI